MSAPINILLFGKFPGHLKAVSKVVQPDCQVIKTASSVEDAITSLSHLSASGDQRAHLVIMGGGFSPADFETVSSEEGAKSVPWLRPDPQSLKGPASGGQPPSAEAVAARIKKGLDQHLGDLKEGKGAGEVWLF